MNKKIENKRSYALGFALTGSLLIIMLCAFINYSTGSSFPWFIYPTFAVLWWPMGVYFSAKRSSKIFSLAGSFLIIVLLFATNYITSWDYPWFLYPAFAVLWWPFSLFFGVKNPRLFSIIGSAVIIAFAVTVNLLTTPYQLWFYYPVLAVLWWPLSVCLARPNTMKAYSLIGSVLLLACLTIENMLNLPYYPWVLYTIFPILLWPLYVFLGRRFFRLLFALGICLAGAAYYILLNILAFPGFPWAIFPVYALLWLPLSSAFHEHKRAMSFSICGTLLSTALFIITNVITSPYTIWAVYPIFGLIWWPLTVYYFVYKPRKIA
jgi:hypothetical protein